MLGLGQFFVDLGDFLDRIVHEFSQGLVDALARREQKIGAAFLFCGRSSGLCLGAFVGFGLFGYGYILLAFGALVVAAEETGCAGALSGLGAPAMLIASAMLILCDRRHDRARA